MTATRSDIAERLKARREYLNISRAEMGEVLGVTEKGYGHYETARVEITASNLGLLARKLGVPVSYFYGEEEQKSGEIVYEPIMDELRAAAYNGVLDGDMVDEIAEDIRTQAKRRAKRQGRD